MEIWKKWVPIEGIPSIIYNQSLIDNQEELNLTFDTEKSKKKVIVKFKGNIFSYRYSQEVIFLRTLDYLHELWH